MEFRPGEFTQVDTEDAALVLGNKWRVNSSGYLMGRERGTRKSLLLHRVILGLPTGDPREVDHLNRDRLDNRRGNLRVVPRDANRQNRSAVNGSTSRFRGVSRTRSGAWRAYARTGSEYLQSTFPDEVEAAIAAQAWRNAHMPYAEPDTALAAELPGVDLAAIEIPNLPPTKYR